MTRVQPAGSVATGSSRMPTLDVVRALAVVLGTVATHAIDGLVNSGALGEDSVLAEARAVGWLIFMPALAFVIGLFVPSAVRRRGSWAYLRSRLALPAWLFVVWYVLQGIIQVAASGVTNGNRTVGSLLEFWRAPDGQLWFLPFLASITISLVLARPWESRVRAVLGTGAIGLVSLATWGWNPDVFGVRGWSLLIYPALGAAIGLGRMRQWLEAPLSVWVLVTVAGGAGMGAMLPLGPEEGTLGRLHPPLLPSLAGMVAGACGVIVVLGVSRFIALLRGLARPLTAVGRETLPIFLAHLSIVAGTRIVLTALGVTAPPLIVVLAAALGSVVPLALARYARRRPWTAWLFELPHRRASRPRRQLTERSRP